MTQIHGDISDSRKEEIDLQIEGPDLEFVKAKAIVKKKAQAMYGETMLLSWHNALTGEYYPTYDCGGSDQPAWIVYAESRGANLTIRVNDGAFTFMFLRLSGSKMGS